MRVSQALTIVYSLIQNPINMIQVIIVGYRLGTVWVFPHIQKSEPLISQGLRGAGNRT